MTRAWDMASLMSNSSFGKIPSGTTANRPASPAVGDQYYNGTLGYLEIYTSSGWKPAGGIPSGNTAGRPSSPSTGQPYFNGELQRLELYTGATYGWQNIVAETPGVTGYTGTVIETNSTNTIVITGTNFAGGATVSLVGSDGTEYNATSVTVSNLTSITATFGAISASLEPYDIKVTNPSNLYGVYYDILTVNDKPLWTTAAGSLGTFNQGTVSYQLQATDEENNSLTYSLVSGTLPTGLTLSSSGLISGTNTGTSNTTYNFTISVSDSSNTAQSRVFSAYVPYPTVTGGTLTSDATYYYRTFTGNGNLVVSGSSISGDILIVGGGGAGGCSPTGSGFTGSGGGGAGSILYKSNHSIPVSTYGIQVGGGGAARNSTSFNNGSNGGDSIFDTLGSAITALGGGGGSNAISKSSGIGANGGSGGGGSNGDPTGSTYTEGAHLTGAPINGGRPGGSAQSSIPSGWTLYANAGGAGAADNNYNVHAGGGGGGAGGAGNITRTADHLRAGDGGIGVNTFSAWATVTGTGSSGYYGGGGGGGGYSWSGDPSMTESNWGANYANYYGRGGSGGGGTGGIGSGTVNPTSALIYTGGGGGGGGYLQQGTSGASGVVIVRYTKASVGG